VSASTGEFSTFSAFLTRVMSIELLFTKWLWKMILPDVAECGGALRKKYQKTRTNLFARQK
jgi:hypothetical protein